MRDIADFGAVPGDPGAVDLSLFGCWPADARCGQRAWSGGTVSATGDPSGTGRAAALQARTERAARRVALELKSADSPSPAESLALLLNQLTVEMRDQFAVFRRLRTEAQATLVSDRSDGDAAAEGPVESAAAKLARADIKAATDAMSLIVRTLEKIDGLQRQVARDRAEAAHRAGMEGDDASVRTRLEALIERRVAERLAKRIAEGAASAAAQDRDRAGPPGAAQDGASERQQPAMTGAGPPG
ncbi:hypothetical protein [Rhizobium halophytocola]|uniref:Uncharacterized protein n=1 Tax=Rhizobium halophytocola TaxID=735519 RepID=A0ABS4E5L2_9HYPH|nr:hypothetical protein [Rhizobium halophytocola]MBP1853222.1 hypothetical protein [Rhizobium halophytocola]